MKNDSILNASVLALAAVLACATARAQAFSSGSTGSDGALVVSSNTTLPVPPSGIFNYTTITVNSGVTLSFTRNALNTPVHMLATGNVAINGTISVVGGAGTNSPAAGGLGGPGGFDGGMPETDGVPPGDGHGPGGGKGGVDSCCSQPGNVGSGSYSTASTNNPTRVGATYGSQLLMPLVGGSGGGGSTGNPGCGGSGGGGAILIASSTRIDIGPLATINADGGSASCTVFGGGSGGAIRLVAPVVAGSGTLRAQGGDNGGHGRIRIDTQDRRTLTVAFVGPAATIGSLMAVFPDVVPRLDLTSVAGTSVSVGSGPVSVLLPFGSPPQQSVTIRAQDFTGVVPVRLLLVPETGDSVSVDGQIDMGTGNPASVTLQANFPVNTVTHVYAYTR